MSTRYGASRRPSGCMSDRHGNIGRMATTTCEHCGKPLGLDKKGRVKRFCDRTCAARGSHRGVYPTTWQERFWRFVTPGAPDDCWEWQGSRDHHSYGRINDGTGFVLKAHRASYELHHGAFDQALDVCHRCDNPPCVNPAHLFLGTARDNALDMSAKGRHGNLPGEASPSARLTDADIRTIRERVATGEPHLPVAQDYGVARGYISLLVTGRVRPEAGGPLTNGRPTYRRRGPR